MSLEEVLEELYRLNGLYRQAYIDERAPHRFMPYLSDLTNVFSKLSGDKLRESVKDLDEKVRKLGFTVVWINKKGCTTYGIVPFLEEENYEQVRA